jgi:predicted nuclease of predicted toxin-antitoxin system
LKLLFHANLSPKLVGRLAELFPGSRHVFETGMAKNTADRIIWEYAQRHSFAIVTADSDFVELAEAKGAPPKVVRIANCNFRTAQVEQLLRTNAIRIAELEQSPRAALTLRTAP